MANHTNTNTFDGKILLAQVYVDGVEKIVLGMQHQLVFTASFTQGFNRELVIDPGHDYIAIIGIGGFVHGEQVTVKNAKFFV